MRFLHDYIIEFGGQQSAARHELAQELVATRARYDVLAGGNPLDVFAYVVERYNWLGQAETKAQFDITQNLARNLPGAILQDFMVNLAIQLCEPYPALDVFTEVRVSFGRYALWSRGTVDYRRPSEQSDLAIGYLIDGDMTLPNANPWPHSPYFRLAQDQSVQPLVTVNAKIRVSQSEFFDWLGREQLMTKGNPHCLSVQVALRKEMNYDIVEAAQARGKFFLFGTGGERNVVPDRQELDRFVNTIKVHFAERMGDPIPGAPGAPL